MTASWVFAVNPLADTVTGWASTSPESGLTFTSGAAPAGAATSPDMTVAAIIETPTTVYRLTLFPQIRGALRATTRTGHPPRSYQA
jgi:hypothetical protein